ncbi:sulfatase-like hydrolase/transferase [Photorhabdus laumondii subsp. laumondii]|uniref:Photorhabdus luminescens subsp. laumondii TTO1 complete genome segment 2/17 n=2 Tax=Photorhabdus laumondii subsp. laumondii TaxID=141679 RepID=Q7N982_PHOLL|nr:MULTISPECIES: LTA synthase family protein [Photorhabdus]AWK40425.1 phosphoglycerol transferase [Photorhabdus laumondii subsp. laumondii]AXG41235.1 LTA synthase family protein [Photorhabdus laumondii subsp. laumondii]AXG45765.1 LTA synthase family protein [Photorhabdus laumondii subsp. laumondii]KTL61146.1 phosphoglycerol transferase [Photorhabdus laumondii subsp. laumondii]MCC8383163.1 LTA synthase family protein [Photorhabdus laumondii]
MWFSRFKLAFIALLLPWLLTVATQMAGRIYLLLTYGSYQLFIDSTQDVERMFWIGGLFDIRIASLLFVPCLLIASLFAINKNSFNIWQHAYPWLATTLNTVVGALTVSNVYYYATYERSFDIFIFGLVEDDTQAVLHTLWNDYPVIESLLCLALFAMTVFWSCLLWQRYLISRTERKTSLPVSAMATLVILTVCFIGMRGSIGTFPLRQSNTQVSEVKMLNMLTPNGPMALNWAFNDHYKNSHFPEATDAQGSWLLNHFLEKPTPANLSPFMAKTADNPTAQKNPPHVIFNVMESMGYHLQSLDRPDLDVFGALRQHWQNDWRFERFISEGDGTIDSLSRFLIRSPNSAVSQSTAQHLDFTSNMFKPYLANGYKIIFVTSGNGAWRNLNQFLPNLGVSEFIDQNGLKKRYPEAKFDTWGVPDEFMFRYIEERLTQAEKNGEHVLIMSLSTTHHPPYKSPAGYQKTDIKLSDTEKQRLSHLASGSELQEVFHTLRYANDQLGQFISWVKSQSLASHTIIAATGDHNIRGISYPDAHELAIGHGVPFYLYVPPAYRQNATFDATRVGSHKDIWPTLYHLSLSHTAYYRTGCNLLAEHLDPIWCQGYNPEVTITQQGAYVMIGKGEFRPWANQTGLLLGDPQPMTADQTKQFKRWQAFTDLLSWQLNRQVHHQQ